MNPYIISLSACLLLALAMVLCAHLGHRFARRQLLANPDGELASNGTVDAAILSLLGLLIAFTFSNAYSRFDTRRQLIVNEVNAIGTAYLRLDLLPSDTQPELRSQFQKYCQSRYDLWKLLPDRPAALAEFARAEQLQQDIWQSAVAATTGETGGDGRKLLLPAINEMIDITTTRLMEVQSHPPLMVFLFLGLLSLAAAWNIGYGMSKSAVVSYPHLCGFAIGVSLALCVILDIEYLRFGLVTLNAPHELLRELAQRIQ